MSSRPASSPCEPADGWRLTCGSPQISLQRSLQAPHQLQRALGALGVLRRVQPGVAGKRGDLLVEPRVVLHRARAERIRARVEVEVAPRDPVVVADDLGLGDLGQARALGAQQALGDQLGERRLVEAVGVGRRQHGRAPALDRALVDRGRGVALRGGRDLRRGRRAGLGGGGGVGHAGASSGIGASFPLSGNNAPLASWIARPSDSASRSMSPRLRRSVIATRRPSSNSGYSRPSA